MGTWPRRGTVFMCSALLTALAGLWAAAPSFGAQRAAPPGELTVARSGPSVAMWVWNWADSAAMVSFAKANRVTEIFAYVAPGFTDPTYIPWGWSQPQLPLEESLAADAAAAGITVYAMGGDPSWVPNPTYGTDWANEALATGLFRGIHVELEPWALSSWGTDRSGTIDQYLSELAGIHAVAATYGVPDEISIPYWLSMYSTRTGVPLDVAAMRNADAATVVTFFNSISQIESFGKAELMAARSVGIPLRFAAEANEDTPSWLSFYGDTLAQFDSAIAHVNRDMTGTPGYLGIAVEDYQGWSAMP
ncbi:MAG TPA: hypothetical protein VIX85_02590 [Acidimicrobiales bacterium]